jgi:uncharacterized protein (DUF302 family)
MFQRIYKSLEAVLMSALILFSIAVLTHASAPDADGIVKVASAYPMAETIARIKADIAKKGIMFFDQIDQQKLAANAGITLRPSTLLIFGNPALGSNFMTSNPISGIDWPVRLLVLQDENGKVWAAYNDFDFIAHRHDITDRMKEFKMASEVVASITSTIR